MPTTKGKTKKIKGLNYKELLYQIDYKPKGIKTSDDLKPCCEIIGQGRAIESIKTGLNVKSRGYNIFVTGPSGTGRTSTIKRLLEQLDYEKPNLVDYCYVNNFKNPDHPQLLVFEASNGLKFKKDMNYLITSVRKIIPKIFMSEDYKDRRSRITREFENRQKDLIKKFEDKLNEAGFVMVQIQAGMGVRNEIQPLHENEPISFDALDIATYSNLSISFLFWFLPMSLESM